MPLGYSLPDKTKQAIWDGKFVELATLLYPETHTTHGLIIDPPSGQRIQGYITQETDTKHLRLVQSIQYIYIGLHSETR